MKIAFHGAARTVTGSKHLLTLSSGKKYLLDCGMFQGLGKDTDRLNREFGFEPSEIDHVILSHAHIDHCGLLPKLVKDGYTGRIFCTPATAELAALLLDDSAGIQESDLRFVNKIRASQGKSYLLPLYNAEYARRASEKFYAVDYGNWFKIDEHVEVLFLEAGHIIGSATVHLKIKDRGKVTHLTFSGDIGRYRDVILRSPAEFPQAEYIIMESTYGNSLHDRVTGTPDSLFKWINDTCVEKGGKLILPAFSVGRTQEILFALNQLELENRLPRLNYFVDSPLSYQSTQILKNYPQYFNSRIQRILKTDDDPFDFKGLRFVHSVEESKSLNYRNEPMVIISASGMAEAGRVKHHISNTIENSRNAIVITGYCEPASLGARLLERPAEVGIFGFVHQVNATIGEIKSMSAHGDFDDLSQWLACQNPAEVKRLFLVHGEYDVQAAFQGRLIAKGFRDVQIPALHSVHGI